MRLNSRWALGSRLLVHMADRTAPRVPLKAVPIMLSSGANQLYEYPSFRKLSLHLECSRHLHPKTKLWKCDVRDYVYIFVSTSSVCITYVTAKAVETENSQTLFFYFHLCIVVFKLVITETTGIKTNFWRYWAKEGTVDIVYNDIGYNDEPDITTELWPKVWPAMTKHAKKQIQRRVHNDETAYNDAILAFFWSVITTKFDDDGQTARFHRKHINTVVAIVPWKK